MAIFYCFAQVKPKGRQAKYTYACLVSEVCNVLYALRCGSQRRINMYLLMRLVFDTKIFNVVFVRLSFFCFSVLQMADGARAAGSRTGRQNPECHHS